MDETEPQSSLPEEPRTVGNGSDEENGENPRPVCYRVLNVDPRATAADLEEHFGRFGQLRLIRVQLAPHSDNGRTNRHELDPRQIPDRSTGEALVCFEEFPVALRDPAEFRKARTMMNKRLEFQLVDINEVLESGHRPIAQHKSAYQLRAGHQRQLMENTAAELSVKQNDMTDEMAAIADIGDEQSLHVSRMEIGSFIGDRRLYMPHVLERDNRVWMYLEFSMQHKKIRWVLSDTHAERDFKFEVYLRDLYELIHVEADVDAQVYWITLDLMIPPKLYAGRYEFSEDVGMWEYSRKFGLVWHRVIHVDPCPNVDFGQHLTFRFKLPHAENRDFIRQMMALNRQGLIANPSNFQQRMDVLYELHVDSFVDYQQDLTKTYGLSFSVYYALLSLVTSGLMSKYLLTPAFLERLVETNEQLARGALETMVQAKRRIYEPLEAYERALKVVPFERKNKIPDHCSLMRKVVITPTRVLFNPESVELGNRVLRHYEAYGDRFIRVSFADENMSKYLDGARISESVHNRLRDILFSGIQCGDRAYSFLAFSSSQLRDHSCWFFADCVDANGEHLTAEMIRKWMGNFDHIRSVAKYAARLGQCFSSTTPVDVSDCQVTEIPDIERNGYCFSDGIGKISLSLAEKIARDMKLESVPSAFQVRMSGYKGVLSVDPTIGPEESPVQFRPSMRKFTTLHNSSLDIIRPSQYSPAFLNHQIITLLSSMQIKDSVFLKLQELMQKNLDSIFSSRDLAMSLLAPLAVEGYAMGKLLKMIACGMSLATDPFISNTLQLYQCSKMKEIKYKARIHVPKGVQLVGVLDESKTLKYGQIFVQYTDPMDSSKRHIVKGTVLMAKMPAVHPGDVRILQCVDKPVLRHYHDVVVFPQNGARPHPNEASGSDLDGDIYFITWDPQLIPIIRNYRPLEYDAPAPQILDRDVNIDDIKNFMVDYMKGDNLGLIATSHKIHADLSVKGVLSQKCIELASLHSIAVDFPKTGIPAEYNPQKYSVRTFPDFLGRSYSQTYESQKALGQLYRAAKLKPYYPVYETTVDSSLIVEGFEDYISEAVETKKLYDFEIKKLMNQYGIRSELETITQLILETNRFNSRKEFEMKRSLNNLTKALAEKYQKKFWKDVGVKQESEDGNVEWRPVFTEEAAKKASAWYQVAYDPKFQKSEETTEKRYRNRRPLFISFPWLSAAEALIQIYQKKHPIDPKSIKQKAPKKETKVEKPDKLLITTNMEKAETPKVYEEYIDGRRFIAGFEVMSLENEDDVWQ